MTEQEPHLIMTDLSTDILVIGKGWSGVKTAQEISDQGYHVLMIDEEILGSENIPNYKMLERLNSSQPDKPSISFQEFDSIKDIEYLEGTRLIRCQGMPGNFSLKLAQGTEQFEKQVGAIVVATDYIRTSLFEDYGLQSSEKVISQSQLEIMLDSEKKEETKLSKTNNVAFVVGFGQEGNPLVMHRIMRCVQDLEDLSCQAYIYVKNIKVAAEGLERLYRDNRQKGAIYFKLSEGPKIAPDGQSITSYDPILDKEIELYPDLIVIEESFQSNPTHYRLSEILGIDIGPWGFLQENNVHRFPVTTNRQGIYVTGSSREVMNLSDMTKDAANVAVEIKKFLANGSKELLEYIGIVDKDKCCFCLTCFRCCPHGAIYLEDKPVISSIACQGCGICASECPQDAIQIVAYRDETIKEKLKKEIDQTKNELYPTIIAFCCENSSFESGMAAQAFQYALPPGLRMIKVPCAGKVDIDYLFTAFTQGADGVMVLACHEGNCQSVRGNTFAQQRVKNLHHLLEEVGLSKERLFFKTLASNMPHQFRQYSFQLEDTLNKIGKNPITS